jgi:hypothetical protein
MTKPAVFALLTGPLATVRVMDAYGGTFPYAVEVRLNGAARFTKLDAFDTPTLALQRASREFCLANTGMHV